MPEFGVTLKADLFDVYKTGVVRVADKAVRALAAEGVARTIQRIYAHPPNGVVDTGAYVNSVYFRTAEEDHGGEAQAAARSRRRDVRFGTTPPPPSRSGEAQILIAVEYGLFIEAGAAHVRKTKRWSERAGKTTVQRIRDQRFATFTHARPSLGPAVDSLRPVLPDFVRQAFAAEGLA